MYVCIYVCMCVRTQWIENRLEHESRLGSYTIKCIHLCCLLIGLNTLHFATAEWSGQIHPETVALELEIKARMSESERNPKGSSFVLFAGLPFSD